MLRNTSLFALSCLAVALSQIYSAEGYTLHKTASEYEDGSSVSAETGLAVLGPVNGQISLFKFDFESCVNLSDTFRSAQDLLLEGFNLTYTYGQEFGTTLVDLLNCPNINPFTAVKCYNSCFGRLLDLVKNIKVDVVDYFSRSKDLLTDIRYEFDECLGIPLPTKVFIQNKISFNYDNKE